MDCIAFGMGELAGDLSAGLPISVVGTLGINEWRERKNLQVIVRDIQYDGIEADSIDNAVAAAKVFAIHGKVPESSGAILPERKHYEKMYRTLYGYSLKMENSVSYMRLANDLGAEKR